MNDNDKSLARNKSVSKLLIALLAVAICIGFMPLISGQAMAASKKPAKVKGLTVSVSADNNVSIKWKKAKKAKKYEVNIKDSTSTLVATKKVKSKKYSFKGQVKTTYTIKVRALNGKQKGKWSSKKTATTNANAEEAAAKKAVEEASQKAKEAEAAAAAAEQKQKETAEELEKKSAELEKAAAAALNDHKDAAGTYLSLIADPTDYAEAAAKDVKAIYDAAYDAIANAKNAEEVDAILANAEAELEKLPTALQEAKDTASKELKAMVDPLDYPEEDRDTIKDIIDAALFDIMLADDITVVEEKMTEALNEIGLRFQTSLEIAQDNAIDSLDNYYLYEYDYERTDWDVIEGIIELAKEDIMDAKDVDKVTEILEDAEKEIKTYSTILDTAKTAAVAELELYKAFKDAYDSEDWTEIVGIIEAAETDIMAEDDVDDVAAILEDAEEEIDAYPTSLGKAQTAAIGELEGYKANKDSYRKSDWADIRDIIDKAEEDIMDADEAKDVKPILDTAKADIAKYATALQKAQTAAKAKLDAYKAFEKAYDSKDWAEIGGEKGIIELAETNIDNAKDPESVRTLLLVAQAAIEDYPTLLETAQLNATLELSEYYDHEKEYEEEDWKNIKSIIEFATASINTVELDLVKHETVADAVTAACGEVEATLTETKNLIGTYQTIVGSKQEKAKAELEAYADDEYLAENYDPEKFEEVKGAVADGKEEIDAAKTVKEVEYALANAKAAIEEIQTLLDVHQREALTYLAQTYQGDIYDGLDWKVMKEVENELSKGAMDILNSEDFNEVDTAKAKAEANIIVILRTAVKDELAKYLEEDFLNNYSPDNKLTVAAIVGLATAAVDEATDYKAMTDIVADAEEAIKSVPTINEESLEEIKAGAKAELNSYKEFKDEYAKADWEKIGGEEGIINKAISDIDKAEDADAVIEIFETAEDAIGNIPTRLETAQKEAINALVGEEGVNLEDYDKEDQESIESIIFLATATINEVEVDLFSFDTVEKAVDAAIEEVKDAQETALALIGMFDTTLDKAKDEAVEILDSYNEDDYDAEDWAEIKTIIETATNNIKDAENVDAVDEILELAIAGDEEQAKKGIADYDTKLDKAKEAAIKDLNDNYTGEAYNEVPWEDMQEILKVIDDASTKILLADDAIEIQAAVVKARGDIAEIFRASAIKELAAYDEEHLAIYLYSEENQNTIKSIITLAAEAIEEADRAEDIAKIVVDAELWIADIPTALEEAQATAVLVLETSVKKDDYYNDEHGKDWDAIQSIIASAETAISFVEEDVDLEDKETTPTNVEVAVTAAKNKVSEIRDSAQEAIKMVPTKLDHAKADAIEDLYTEYVEGASDELDWGTIQKIQQAIKAAAVKMDKADDEEEIAAVVADAKMEIAKIMKNPELKQLDDYIANCGQYYENSDLAKIEAIIALAKQAVIAAKEQGEIDAAMNNAKTAIDLVPTILDHKKVEAIQTLNESVDPFNYNKKEWEDVQSIIEDAVDEIIAVHDFDANDFVNEESAEGQVNAVVEKAKEEIAKIDTKLDKYMKDEIQRLRDTYTGVDTWGTQDWTTMHEVLDIINKAEQDLKDKKDAGELIEEDDVDAVIEPAEVAIAEKLTDFREEAIAKLEQLIKPEVEYEHIPDPEDEIIDDWEKVKAAYDLGVAAIRAAEEFDQIDEPFVKASLLITSVPTILEKEKAAAIEKLNTYAVNPTDSEYDEEGKADIKAAIDEGTAAIEDVEIEGEVNEEAVAAAVDAVKGELDKAIAKVTAVPTALDNAKTEAIEDLEKLAKDDKYDALTQGELKAILSDAKEAINAATKVGETDTDVDSVKKALADAKAELDKAGNEAWAEYIGTLIAAFDDKMGEKDYKAAYAAYLEAKAAYGKYAGIIEEAGWEDLVVVSGYEDADAYFDAIVNEIKQAWTDYIAVDLIDEFIDKYGMYNDTTDGFEFTEPVDEQAAKTDWADVASAYAEYIDVYGEGAVLEPSTGAGAKHGENYTTVYNAIAVEVANLDSN